MLPSDLRFRGKVLERGHNGATVSARPASPGMVYPAQNEKLVEKLKEKNITCFAMDPCRLKL